MTVFFAILAVFFFLSTVGVGVVAWRYAKMLFNVEDNMDIAIDAMNEQYTAITTLFKGKQVLHSEPTVKRFMEEVENQKNIILFICNALTQSTTEFHLQISGKSEVPAPSEDDDETDETLGVNTTQRHEAQAKEG